MIATLSPDLLLKLVLLVFQQLDIGLSWLQFILSVF